MPCKTLRGVAAGTPVNPDDVLRLFQGWPPDAFRRWHLRSRWRLRIRGKGKQKRGGHRERRGNTVVLHSNLLATAAGECRAKQQLCHATLEHERARAGSHCVRESPWRPSVGPMAKHRKACSLREFLQGHGKIQWKGRT